MILIIFIFSYEYFYLVANIQNLTTGTISPQYYVVFEKNFREFVGLGKMKCSLILFAINFLNTIDIVMLRNSLDRMVN